MNNMEKKEITNISFWMRNINSKTTIIMLHGIGSSANFVADIAKYKTNFNVVSLDLPGSKNGPKINDLKIQDIAVKVNRFIREHVRSKNIILLGHSLGGAVAAKVAHECKKVDEVIFLSPFTPFLANTSTYKAASAYMNLGDSKIDFAKKAVIGTTIKLVAKAFGFSNLGAFTDEESNEHALLKNNVYNNEYITKELMNDYKLAIKKPSLFIVSEKDIVVGGEDVVKFAKSIDVKCITLQGGDHNPFTSSTKKLVKILNSRYPYKKRQFGRKIIDW